MTEAEPQAKAALRPEVEQHPLMQAIRAAFPEAKISRSAPAPRSRQAAEAEALPELPDDDDTPDDWDPFED
jgi:DNA polymerase-3 subunit gamma/tau